MALARVVSFEGVGKERMAELVGRMGESDGPPADVPARGIVVLHDVEGEGALAILFFENEDDYRRGDAALSAMPADETPGRRASVTRYEVAFRMDA